MIDAPLAFSYKRCSTPEQLRGDSFRRQDDAASRFALETGLILDDKLSFDDRGVSAYKGANKEAGLGRFLAAVEDGSVPKGSYLLVENLDRLSRQTVLRALGLLQEIVEAGITVVTLSDRATYSTETLDRNPGALLMALVVMMRAHEESALKSSRGLRAWEAKRKRARESMEAMTERCPAWLRIEHDRYVEVTERADVVRWMFERTIAGDGKRKIVADIRDRGILPWGRGVTWHESYVQKILMSEATWGRFTPLAGNAAPIDNYFPVTIPQDTFWAAQAARAERRTNRITVPPGKALNIFAGVGKCGACGHGMHYQDKGVRSAGPYLVCGAYRTGGACTNGSRWMYRDIVRILVQTACLLSEDGLAPDQVAQSASQDQLIAARERHASATRKLAALTEAIGAGAGASLATAHAAADIEVVKANEGLAQAETAARNAAPVKPDWDALYGILCSTAHPVDDPAWRQATAATLRRILTRIEFGLDRTTLTVFRNGESHASQFGAEDCRLPGERYSEANTGWFNGQRDEFGKPTKGNRARAVTGRAAAEAGTGTRERPRDGRSPGLRNSIPSERPAAAFVPGCGSWW